MPFVTSAHFLFWRELFGRKSIDLGDLIATQNHQICHLLERRRINIGCPLLIGTTEATRHQSALMVHGRSSRGIGIEDRIGRPGEDGLRRTLFPGMPQEPLKASLKGCFSFMWTRVTL